MGSICANGEVSRKTVMVVEDDDDLRNIICLSLVELDYQVCPATNGREALDLLERLPYPPCVILLDLMMPVMNGWEMLEELAARESWSAIPVVVVSAYEENERETRCDRWLRKPVEWQKLRETISEYCG